MTSRSEVVGQNGPDGEYYLVEKVARYLCKMYEEDPDEVYGGRASWAYYTQEAMVVIGIVREFDKGVSNAKD